MGEGRHSKTPQRATERRGFHFRSTGVLTAVALLVALAGVGTALALQNARRAHAGAPGSTTSIPAHTTTTTLPPPPPLAVTSISPASGTNGVAAATTVTVQFNEPIAANSPLPKLSPSPPGSWVRSGATAVRFVPTGYFAPFSTVQVIVPGGSAGIRSQYGQSLGTTVTNHFSIAGGSELRLQQLLAELGFLPLRFVPAPGTGAQASTTGNVTGAGAAPSSQGTVQEAVNSEPTLASDVSPNPAAGSFQWRFGNIPSSLSTLWSAGHANVITTGAVMAFESAHGLATDGVAGPAVWSALLSAVAQRQVTTAPYDYVYVSTTLPETVYVWRDGKVVYSTLANTGIPQDPTAVGTWPVYLRFTVTTMSGTNPNGTPYHDTGIPWTSYFNGGDALHGFIRPGYGYPQSLGCVEMPFASAAIVWPMTPIGTLVTIL